MIIEKLRFYERPDMATWPFFLSPIKQIINDDLIFNNQVTFLVGENGSGKSTLIEAIAEVYGLDVRGGHGGRQYASNGPPKGILAEHLKLELTVRGHKAKNRGAQGFFLRSESALGMLEFMSDVGVPGYGNNSFRSISHGEGYIQVLASKFQSGGLLLLDEPEAALSFSSSLALIQELQKAIKNGSQIICATHSPIICAFPGAEILELSDEGIQKKEWSELALVQHWQRFMALPDGYLNDL